MDFLNGLGRKFSNAARTVQNFTREGNESSRISAELRTARTEAERCFAALGRACYARDMQDGGEIPAELYRQAEEWTERVNLLTARHEQSRNPVRCPSCGSPMSPDARFCSHCGRPMPESAPILNESVSDEPEFCPECGAMRQECGRYCALCGHAFFPEDAAAVPNKPRTPLPEPPEEPVDSHRYDE